MNANEHQALVHEVLAATHTPTHRLLQHSMQACFKCARNGNRLPPSFAVGRMRQRDGVIVVKIVCRDCLDRGDYTPLSDALGGLPEDIRNDRRIPLAQDHLDSNILCERCGDGSQGVQEHHWAPRSIFKDEADRWPTSFLCIRCHEEWHSRTGIADAFYRKAAA